MLDKNTKEVPYLQMQKKYDLLYLDLVKKEELQEIINRYTRVKNELEFV